MQAKELVVVLSTAPDRDTALRIARELVDRQLAACVNVVPGLTSVYRWQGAVAEDEELLLVIKTRHALLAALEAALIDAHPYDVPELVALPVEAVHEPYGRWLLDQTAGASGGAG